MKMPRLLPNTTAGFLTNRPWTHNLTFATCGALTMTSLVLLRRHFTTNGPKPAKGQRGNKAIFISGCDSGFGYSLAVHLARDLGFRVIAGCFRPLSGDNRGRDSLRKEAGGSGNLHTVDLDVTSDQSIRDASQITDDILKGLP